MNRIASTDGGRGRGRSLPWPAALAVLLAGALGAAAVDWTVAVKSAEVKDAPEGFSRGTVQLENGETFDGVLEGDWVRVREDDVQGYVHRSALAAEGEELEDPYLAFRIAGTSYPDDLLSSDRIRSDWMEIPVVRDTGRAPPAWTLEEFRRAGGLGGAR
ncbi:MAG: hypothetical protein IT452_05295 [Planctomycetia bacterium]|nr:hypothetical protein [Planctomycetia bacterium]